MSAFSGDDAPTAAEAVVIAVSVTVTLTLFGYVALQAATAPAHRVPSATATGTQPTDDGRVAVAVEVEGPRGTGLQSVTAGVDCANESITFQHVPAGDSRNGVIVCPAGTEDPSASIRSWIET